jgi:hypothetical protein
MMERVIREVPMPRLTMRRKTLCNFMNPPITGSKIFNVVIGDLAVFNSKKLSESK